jgi:hypothetical protein
MPPPKTKERSSVFSLRKGITFIVLTFCAVWFLVALRVLHSPSQETIIIKSPSKASSGRDTEATTIDLYPEGAPPVIGIHHTIIFNNDDVSSEEENDHHHQQQQEQHRTTEIVYAISKNYIPTTTSHDNEEVIVVQVALLLHGCSHSALKFFSPSSSCPTCIGLSEELTISRLLLQEETSIAAVMAVTSQDRTTGCWASQKDLPHIQDALQYVSKQLDNLPWRQQQQRHVLSSSMMMMRVWAFGASSGGRFAAELAILHGTVDAAMVGVMTLGTNLVQKWKDLPTSKQPPIYLAPMPRDKRTLRGNEQDFAGMMTQQQHQQNNGSSNSRVVLDIDTCTSFPVTALYLHQRVPHMTMDMATNIVSQLQDKKHMDPVSGMLLQDPTQSDWRNVLHATCGAVVDTTTNSGGCLQNQPLGPGISPLAKALHRAWAFHEYCSEVTLKALHFFQQQLQ